MTVKKRRRIMRAFKIEEISAVDRPAQEGARSAILKRDTTEEGNNGVDKFDRVDLLTSSVDGHQHGIKVSRDGDETYLYVSYAGGEEGTSHDHQIMVTPEGDVVMSENMGHTHEIDRDDLLNMLMSGMSMLKGEPADPIVETAEPNGEQTVNEQEIAEMQTALKRSEAIVAMDAPTREFFDGLSKADQDAFIEKSAEDQAADIAKAAEANEVVYTDRKGRTYTKADGDKIVELAKENDANEVAKEEAEVEAADADLTKRAEGLDFLSGTLDQRKELLKSIDAIEDKDARENALAVLKSKNAANESATETLGSAGSGEDPLNKSEDGGASVTKAAEAVSKLDELAKAKAESDGMSYAKAYDAVLQTAEGRQLYAASKS